MKGPLLVGLAALLGASCYGVPELTGPYRCGEGGGCADPAMVCDDGVCCHPTGQPSCRSFVLDGGCADGGLPARYFQDGDGDGFGNSSAPRLYCAPPAFDPYISFDGDCDDQNAQSHPDAKEECDGLDNDCDGTPDDGLTLSAFYEDADNDGYGDPASERMFCAPPVGWVSNQSDCAPNASTRHPGAPERCNGRDDDCNGAVDDDPIGMGEACLVPGKLGVCAQGAIECSAGAPSCQSLDLPSADRCDGLDNDCDGQVDERPDCGGPSDLFASAPEITRGAQNVGAALNGTSTTCVKNYPGSMGETWSAPAWTGSGSTSHVFWVETSRSWDLSRPGTRIHLKFDHSMLRNATTPWAAHGQPVIYLCGPQPTNLMRLVHAGAVPAMSGANGTVEETIPIAGNANWVIGAATNIDLTRVKRIEVVVQPNYNATQTPTFTIRWQGGSGFLP